jgi:hypothetical protein
MVKFPVQGLRMPARRRASPVDRPRLHRLNAHDTGAILKEILVGDILLHYGRRHVGRALRRIRGPRSAVAGHQADDPLARANNSELPNRLLAAVFEWQQLER